VTSTSVLLKTIKYLGGEVDFYIPNRETEGHGLNTKALVKLMSQKKPKLIITVDNGISNIDEVKVLETETKPVVAEVGDTTPVVPKTWSPEVESNEDESTIEQNDGIDSEIDESECTPEEEVATDVIESNANDTTDEDNNYTDDSDDEDDDDDIVLASDINLNRHHRPKNSYIAPEYNMGKNKKKKNGMKSNFIPQQ
jgi:hypothetical protein